MRARAFAATSLALMLALVLGACGDDDDDVASSDDGTTPADLEDLASDALSDAEDAAEGIEEEFSDALSDELDQLASDGIDLGDINDECVEALEEYRDAFAGIGSSTGLADIADAADGLADSFPEIEEELHTVADAARAASEGDASALLNADVAEAGARIGEYFQTECAA